MHEEAHESVRELYNECYLRQWLQPRREGNNLNDRFYRARPSDVGLVVQIAHNVFVLEPPGLELGLQKAAAALGSKVTMTMCSEVTASIFQLLQDAPAHTALRAIRHNLPVIDSLEDLSCTSTSMYGGSFACLVKDEKVVVVCTQLMSDLVIFVTEIENRLLGMLYGQPLVQPTPISRPLPLVHRPHSFSPNIQSVMSSSYFPKPNEMTIPGDLSKPPSFISRPPSVISSPIYEEKNVFVKAFELEDGRDLYDPEIESAMLPKRPMALTRSFTVSLGVMVVVLIQGVSISRLIEETLWDGNKTRLALIVLCPVFIAFALFFMTTLIGSAFQLFGPVFDIASNTRFHSAKAPSQARHRNLELPHVTIQVPVYKEGLKGVIAPTIASLQAAVRFYESRGGSASIFVCEDGMQVVNPEIAEARKAFYEVNSIGWCARPGHKQNGFIRSGQFKKASNLNYSIDFSMRVEDEFFRLVRERIATTGCSEDDIVGVTESKLYKQALDHMLEKDAGKTWASGNLRMGEIILLVDSDTRVPIDCLLTGALEMHESPEVAILQHVSGVMNVTGSSFENGIAYFTRLIYTSIKYAVGSGDHAPFVGHNAFLRWKTIQAIGFEEDGVRKYWTDKHVSEDFQLALKIQIQGSIVRLASYHGDDFKEGVSLTVFDELSRWQKYAFGCNEIIFNPIYRWHKGPITPLFWQFVFSNIKPTSKISILAYMSTYYAIASAVPITLVNYILVGWFAGSIDKFYINSWKVFVGIVFCFNIAAPIAFAALRHRLGMKKALPALIENMRWVPFFVLFFGGLSLNLLKALACHFVGIPMEWGSTAKELEATSFFVGLDRIMSEFRYTYLIMLSLTGMMIYLGIYASDAWKITDWTAIVPLANQIGSHCLLPIVLGLN